MRRVPPKRTARDSERGALDAVELDERHGVGDRDVVQRDERLGGERPARTRRSRPASRSPDSKAAPAAARAR